jgi:hypothetical protein
MTLDVIIIPPTRFALNLVPSFFEHFRLPPSVAHIDIPEPVYPTRENGPEVVVS